MKHEISRKERIIHHDISLMMNQVSLQNSVKTLKFAITLPGQLAEQIFITGYYVQYLIMFGHTPSRNKDWMHPHIFIQI